MEWIAGLGRSDVSPENPRSVIGYWSDREQDVAPIEGIEVPIGWECVIPGGEQTHEVDRSTDLGFRRCQRLGVTAGDRDSKVELI